MGLRQRARDLNARKEEIEARDTVAERRVDVKALNMKKIPGVALEDKLNEWADLGYAPVCSVGDYVILSRPI